MDQIEVPLEDFLAQVEFGEVRFKVVDKKLFSVPKQRIERSPKCGTRIEIVIDEPIRLKSA